MWGLGSERRSLLSTPPRILFWCHAAAVLATGPNSPTSSTHRLMDERCCPFHVLLRDSWLRMTASVRRSCPQHRSHDGCHHCAFLVLPHGSTSEDLWHSFSQPRLTHKWQPVLVSRAHANSREVARLADSTARFQYIFPVRQGHRVIVDGSQFCFKSGGNRAHNR